ncbi:hypothetical protein ANN_21885 [Periplaneta americana]|uniref:Uncharacterized protein n=1 Tax=Periplaneta americana TaxID=6978 RepID=A0ABQ8S6L3_PERAM|nr:hypothetical protein ANN_21885 [Periplaneta americana]
MDNNNIPKRLLDATLSGKRRAGRPKLRWLDDVQDDLVKSGIKRWRRRALEREDWVAILKKVKAKLKGLQARKIVFKVYNYFKNVDEQNAAGHLEAGCNVANAQETSVEACGVGLRNVQRILLVKKRRLFITQCGLQSLQEAVYHGVPLLGVPILIDHRYNAMKTEDDGIRIRLSLSELTKETLLDAINAILSNSRKELPDIPLPPQPVLTRLGTWLKETEYYNEHFLKIQKVIKDLPEDAVCVTSTKLLFEDPSISRDLAYIRFHYTFLVTIISELDKALLESSNK